jgi:hypothetical protein
MSIADRKQIGLTDDGKAAVAMLTDRLGWFAEAQEASRFALAYALRQGIGDGSTSGAVETRWSADGFDPTGEIRSVLRAAYPENTTPVRLMEHLIDEGLRLIQGKLAAGHSSPLDFFDALDVSPIAGGGIVD